MVNSKQLKLAVVQQACDLPYKDALQRSLDGIKDAASQGAQCVLLPELHTSRYFCQTADHENFELAEAVDGSTVQALAKAAKASNIVVIGSIFERRMPGVFHNTAVVLDSDGSTAGIYRKMHIPDDPGYYEKYYFTPGDLGFTPIETSIGKLGVLVCWDQWYPEAARLMALRGAEILFYPTAIGWDPEDTEQEQQAHLESWMTVQRGHAVANHLPVVTCNRVGYEADPSQHTQGQTFWGNSFITNQQGQLLAQGDSKQEQVLVAQVDLARTEKLRQIWPYFRDRRIEAFAGLLKRSD